MRHPLLSEGYSSDLSCENTSVLCHDVLGKKYIPTKFNIDINFCHCEGCSCISWKFWNNLRHFLKWLTMVTTFLLLLHMSSIYKFEMDISDDVIKWMTDRRAKSLTDWIANGLNSNTNRNHNPKTASLTHTCNLIISVIQPAISRLWDRYIIDMYLVFWNVSHILFFEKWDCWVDGRSWFVFFRKNRDLGFRILDE